MRCVLYFKIISFQVRNHYKNATREFLAYILEYLIIVSFLQYFSDKNKKLNKVFEIEDDKEEFNIPGITKRSIF